MPRPGQLIGHVPQRLRRPPQRRLRITPLVRLHQRRNQLRVDIFGVLTATTDTADPAFRQRILTGFQLENTFADGSFADTGRQRHSSHPAMSQRSGLTGQHQPPLSLVQMRQHRREPLGQTVTDLARHRHTTPKSLEPQNNTLLHLRLHNSANVLASLPNRRIPVRSRR